MVLYKRKPVVFQRPPEIPEDFDYNSDVWYINETGEWFLTYEDYLERLEYYNVQKFGCEVTGNTNFTFFQAFEVERSELEAVRKFFPEPVREPILRYVQFSEVPRLDNLVDEVYVKFKNDFFPGDSVIVRLPGGDRAKGIVREKARFNSITLPDGEVRDAYCSYRILFENDVEITCNESNLARHRNAFTKWYLRTFLKMSLKRATRTGSPWVVKDEFAAKYRISTEYPPHLKEYEVWDKVANHKKMVISRPKNHANGNSADGEGKKSKSYKFLEPHVFDNMKETPPLSSTIQDDGKSLQEWKDGWYNTLKHCTMYYDTSADETPNPSLQNKINHLFKYAGVTVVDTFDPATVNFIISARPYVTKAQYDPSDIYYYVSKNHIKVWHCEKTIRFFKNLNITIRKIQQSGNFTGIDGEEIKYTKSAKDNQSSGSGRGRKPNFVNILPAPPGARTVNGTNGTVDNLPKTSTTINGQPSKVFTSSRNRNIVDDLVLPFQLNLQPRLSKLTESEAVSELLEVWVFMNMYAKAFLIDTFTFDDFLGALNWKDYEEQCPLLNEMFCALLKCIMDESGNLLVTLPKEEETSKSKGNTNEEDTSIVIIGSDNEEDGETPVSVKREKSEQPPNANGATVDDGAAADDEQDSGDEDQMDVSIDNESEDEEEEDIEHNAYSLLEYRKVSWKTRLANRQFKDGNFQIILLGVLSLVEHVPLLKQKISKIYECLAPGDISPTPATVAEKFYTDLTIDMRIDILSILMNLLLSGTVVRNHIDKCLDESTIIRRERLDLLKDLKAAIEEASALHKEVTDALEAKDTSAIEALLAPKEGETEADTETTKTEQQQQNTEDDTNKAQTKRRGGRPIQNTLPDEPTALEKAVAQSDPEFLKKLKVRTDLITKVNEFKQKKKELEKKLNEIDCQRVKYIGRDRLFNRYWWFESNGLPNLNSGSREDDEENNEDEDEIEEESDSEFVEDTYFMGRLWIQGPSNEDRNTFLKFDDEQLNKWNEIVQAEKEKLAAQIEPAKSETADEVKEEENGNVETVKEVTPLLVSEPVANGYKRELEPVFCKASETLFGLTFKEDSILDHTGSIVVDQYGAATDRPLKPMERKLIEEGAGALLTSANWSYIDSVAEFDKLYHWLSPNGERERVLRRGMALLQDSIRNSLNSRRKALGLGKKSDREIETEKELASIVISESEESELEEDEEEDSFSDSEESDLESKPRTRRTIHIDSEKKRQREEEMERRAAKRAKRATKPSERIAKRQAKKRKAQEHQDKRDRIASLEKRLSSIRNNQGRDNVLAWVNSSAIEAQGYSHYEGPKVKVAAKKKRGRR